MNNPKENKINDEIMAAISAAIASINDRPGYKLVVRSFRRVPQVSPVWNTAGRIERIQSRLS